MEKHNLYPILHSVKYNKLEVVTDAKNNTFDEFSESHKLTQELQHIDSLGSSSINDNPILNDESDTIIDELFEKNHVLQARWKIMQQRIDHLKRENEQLHDLLKEERIRTTKYQQKLHYIQENQPVFEKLKQAYISLKYNEQKDRSLIEVKERGCQTLVPYQEIAQETPTKDYSPQSDFSLSRNVDDEINFAVEPGYMPIKTKHFNEMKKTVQTLKTLIISQPLSTFVLSENKEAKYRQDIADMFLENRGLKQLVVDQQLELDSAKEQLTLRKTSKESSLLKKIIAKVDRQIRSCKTCNNKINFESTLLNETEKKIIGHISTKYELKLQLKQDGSEPVTPKTPRSATPFYTPRSTRYEDFDNLRCRSARTDGPDTYRSCDDNLSFDSI